MTVEMTHDSDARSDVVVTDLRVSIETHDGRLDAISGVSLVITPGQSVGVVGESGSGKSLLCRSIMGLVDPNVVIDGSVVVGGRETVGLRSRQRRRLWGPTFAMVFQDPTRALSPVKRIGEQLATPIRFHAGVSKRQAMARGLELMEAMGIPDPTRCLRQYPHELSGGMRQRVVIALAVSADPLVVFADEPTTALDVTVQAQVLDVLDAQRADGHTALVLCSHDLNVVAGRTDVVAVMYAGQVVEMASTQELFAAPRMPYTVALLEATPQIDQPSHSRLPAIPGRPPGLTDRPTGCRFAPRCPHATARCELEMPPLVEAEPGHLVRCWHPRHIGAHAGRAELTTVASPRAVAG